MRRRVEIGIETFDPELINVARRGVYTRTNIVGEEGNAMGIEIVGVWKGNPEEDAERVGIDDMGRWRRGGGGGGGGGGRRHHGGRGRGWGGGKQNWGPGQQGSQGNQRRQLFMLGHQIRRLAKTTGAVDSNLIAQWAALKVQLDQAKPGATQHDSTYWSNVITQKLQARFPNVNIAPGATGSVPGSTLAPPPPPPPPPTDTSLAPPPPPPPPPPAYDESNMDSSYSYDTYSNPTRGHF